MTFFFRHIRKKLTV